MTVKVVVVLGGFDVICKKNQLSPRKMVSQRMDRGSINGQVKIMTLDVIVTG